MESAEMEFRFDIVTEMQIFSMLAQENWLEKSRERIFLIRKKGVIWLWVTSFSNDSAIEIWNERNT